jgi:hypothetical protein
MSRFDRIGAAAVVMVLAAAVAAAACGAELGADTATTAAAVRGDERGGGGELLEGRLTGVPRPYTGAVNAIRGVPGGGLPWVLSSGEVELREDGRLEVEVDGLVFDPADATVIERGLAGRNNVAAFKAIVSCLSIGSDGAATTVNVETATAPATQGLATEGGGDAFIEAQLALPTPCLAPIVFVTSPTGAWFATTGR